MFNPFASEPAAEERAPIKVMLELWPLRMKGRATIERDGKAQDVEISAPYIPMILSVLKTLTR